MIRRSIFMVSLLVLGLSVSSAQAQVRDPISRKFSPEKGFFENSSRSTASRSYSSRSHTPSPAVPVRSSSYRNTWFWRFR
ncbi:MAG: hypothetical protein ACK553_01795 [Planctomycetota bacterium]|jgi:hypothetical protein